jgi:chromosome segregation ATPase
MPYSKYALRKFKREQIIDLYIVDQQKWIEESKQHDETVKELMIQKAQAENSYNLLSDTYQVKLRESCNKYRVKISQLEKENEELKSQINSNSPNNLTLIKNLKNANTKLKEEIEKAKEEHIHFNTIWKTEGITEQDIIDMKRQISDQCDIIKTLKQEHKELTKKQEYYYKLINKIKPLMDEMFDSL